MQACVVEAATLVVLERVGDHVPEVIVGEPVKSPYAPDVATDERLPDKEVRSDVTVDTSDAVPSSFFLSRVNHPSSVALPVIGDGGTGATIYIPSEKDYPARLWTLDKCYKLRDLRLR